MKLLRLKTGCCVVVAIGCLITLGCRGGTPGGDAAKVFTQSYSQTKGGCSIHHGDLLVVEGDGIFFGGEEVSLGYFREELQKWEKAGLLSITAEDVLSSNKRFSWNDWFARTQRGELKRVHVEATAKGRELTTVSEIAPQILQGRCYRQVLEEIVTDDETEVRTERYRVIQARVRHVPEELGELLAAVDEDPWIRGDFKVRLLLRWDPFTKQWLYTDRTRRIVGGSDIAPLSEDFRTENGLPPAVPGR